MLVPRDRDAPAAAPDGSLALALRPRAFGEARVRVALVDSAAAADGAADATAGVLTVRARSPPAEAAAPCA